MSSPTAISYQPTTRETEEQQEEFTEQMATDGMETGAGGDFEERNGIRRWIARIRRQTTVVPTQQTTKAPPMASFSTSTLPFSDFQQCTETFSDVVCDLPNEWTGALSEAIKTICLFPFQACR